MNEKISEYLSKLSSLHVPVIGAANLIIGEILRAYGRIYYRLYNDGDYIGIGYGKETCNYAARYLQQNTNNKIESYISDHMWGVEYDEKELNHLAKLICNYITSNKEVYKKNNDDMINYRDPNEDVDNEEEEYYCYYEEELEKNDY